jgi:hypothetical protein
MNRTNLLSLFNYLLFLSTCALISTGLALEIRFERGGQARTLLAGLSRHDWAELHYILALSFIVLSLAHLALNWSWVVKAATHGKSLLLGVSVGLGLLIIGIPLLIPDGPEELRSHRGADLGPALQKRTRQHQALSEP